MLRKTVTLFMCAIMLATAALAFAGGTPGVPCGPVCYPPRTACAPGAGPNSSAYWGDAPFPGLCGGVVALPFLVVGSLLGGNPSGPYGPGPAGGYGYAPQGSACAPMPCAPQPCPPRAYAAPCAPQPCGPPPCGPAQYAQAPCPPAPPCAPYAQQGPCGQAAGNSGSIFGGLPCLELCSGLLGNITGGMNLLY